MAAEGRAQDTKKPLIAVHVATVARAPLAGRSADQSAQPVSLRQATRPLSSSLRSARQLGTAGRSAPASSPFQPVPWPPFHRHGGRTSLARFKRKYAVKLGGVDLVVAGVGPGR